MPDRPTPGRMEIAVDREQCMGTGTCMVYAPATFTFDDDGKAAVLPDTTDDDDAVATAIEACPTSALRVVGPQS